MQIGGRGQRRSRVLPGDFQHMEAAAQLRGVGEGLKLAHHFRLGPAFEREQPLAADFGEPGALIAKNARLATERNRGLGDGGEIVTV